MPTEYNATNYLLRGYNEGTKRVPKVYKESTKKDTKAKEVQKGYKEGIKRIQRGFSKRDQALITKIQQ